MENEPENNVHDLDSRIKALKEARGIGKEEKEPVKRTDPMQMVIEFVVPIVVGFGLGLMIDKWLGTLPIFMLLFFVLGVATAGYTIYKHASGGKHVTRFEAEKKRRESS